MKNSTLRVLALVWAALMIAVLSSTATLLITGRASFGQVSASRWVSQDEFDVIERYRKLDQVRQTLVDEYYTDVDEDALVLGAIRGMASSIGDPYTFYYTPEELRRANENNAGLYHGIGTLLQNTDEGRIEVVRVYPDTPAEAAGLRVGDLILAVDGAAVSGVNGRTYNDAVSRIRGEDGTNVVLTVQRDGARMDIAVTRGDVTVSYASWQVLPGDIGYIAISQFRGDAEKVFNNALEAFRAKGVKGLIVDVRNNPGGMLDMVVNIADRLLPKGLIVYVKTRDGAREDFYSDDEYYDVPLAVLVNDMSASASEILAGAVQALGRGTVVGQTTYGKGIVQSLHVFAEDESCIQLTTSSYYDAADRCPQTVGVTPDVVVAPTGAANLDVPDVENDAQLAAAVEEVENMINGRSQ